MIIRSAQNERFRSWKKLLTKKGRREQLAFLVEGEHLVEEALKAGWARVLPSPTFELIQAESYQLSPEWLARYPFLTEQRTLIADSLFAELAETQTPQGIALKVAWLRQDDLASLLQRSRFILLIDEVQDPGNVGTIIRTADAAGVDALLLGRGTVDPFSGKVLRATQGSIFHIPIIEVDLLSTVQHLKGQAWKVYASALQGAEDYRTIQIERGDKTALIVGNEGRGIHPALLQLIAHKIKIPLWGQAESLNVSVATGILLYHIQAQYKQERGK